jgi:aspartyl-tRNA synthetase
MVGSEVLEECGEKISKKESKKRAAKLEKLLRKQEREEATSSSLSLEEEDESCSSNYGDVTTNELQSAVEGKELTDVSNLVEEIVGSEVSIRGRLHKNRLVGTKLFVILRESGFTVQCVVEETRVGANMIKFVKQLSRESVVELIGVVSHPKKPLTGTTQQVEIHVRKMYCLSRSLPNLPLVVEDAARSESDIEKSGKVE